MEVMDLSLPKSHQVSSYHPQSFNLFQHHQQQYMLHQQYLLQLQQKQYATTVLPPQPSVNHLGFFQQLQHNNLPPVAPILLPRKSPTNYETTHPYSGHVVETAKEKEASINKDGNCRPHGIAKRPFKLIAAKNSTSLSLPAIIDPNSDEAYEEYRNKVLSQVVKGESESNRNMRRTIPSNPEKCNDPEYLEKRRKNNEAAKKSREARKAKEDEIAIRVSFLEKENLKLKFQLAAIERQKKMYLMRLEQKQKRHHTTACF